MTVPLLPQEDNNIDTSTISFAVKEYRQEYINT